MKNSVILKVTNDTLELPVNLYDSTAALAQELNTSKDSVRHLLRYNPIKKQYKYIRVYFKD